MTMPFVVTFIGGVLCGIAFTILMIAADRSIK